MRWDGGIELRERWAVVEGDAIDGEDASGGVGGEGDEADFDELQFSNEADAMAAMNLEAHAPGEEADAAFAQGAGVDEAEGVDAAAGGEKFGAKPEAAVVFLDVVDATERFGDVVLPKEGDAMSASEEGVAEGAGLNEVGLGVEAAEGGGIAADG